MKDKWKKNPIYHLQEVGEKKKKITLVVLFFWSTQGHRMTDMLEDQTLFPNNSLHLHTK